LKGGKIWQVFGEVASNTAFIYLLLFGTIIFTFFVGVTQIPNTLVDAVATWQVHPLIIIGLIAVIYIALGCVMESITVMLISVPVVVPLMVSLGYDLVWWGIVTVVIVEIGVLTPPIGINCFMIRSLAPDISLATIFRGVMPFVASSILKLVILVLFPILTLWLPQHMMR
jgi:C4-dicarboxylate transporter DctM subunit